MTQCRVLLLAAIASLTAGPWFAGTANAAQIGHFEHNYGSVDIILDLFNGQPGGKYLWRYTVINHTFDPNPGVSNGFSGFELFLPSPIPEICRRDAEPRKCAALGDRLLLRESRRMGHSELRRERCPTRNLGGVQLYDRPAPGRGKRQRRARAVLRRRATQIARVPCRRFAATACSSPHGSPSAAMGSVPSNSTAA